MHKTPKKVFDEIATERPYCERADIFHDHECSGRSTMEHAWIYAGRQINEKWAIIRLCEYAHSVGPYAMNGILNKRINQWISLQHATDEDLKKYPRMKWELSRNYAPKPKRPTDQKIVGEGDER